MRIELILLGTKGCHLCDEAESLLEALALPYRYIDIIEDEKLLESYATSIPVLLDDNSRARQPLCWPFNHATLTNWLTAIDEQ